MQLVERVYRNDISILFEEAFTRLYQIPKEDYKLLVSNVVNLIPTDSKVRGNLLEALNIAPIKDPKMIYKVISSDWFNDEVSSWSNELQEEIKEALNAFNIRYRTPEEEENLNDLLDNAQEEVINKTKEIANLTSKLNVAYKKIDSQDEEIYRLKKKTDQLSEELKEYYVPFGSSMDTLADYMKLVSTTNKENKELKEKIKEKDNIIEEQKEELVEQNELIEKFNKWAENDRRESFRDS